MFVYIHYFMFFILNDINRQNKIFFQRDIEVKILLQANMFAIVIY